MPRRKSRPAAKAVDHDRGTSVHPYTGDSGGQPDWFIVADDIVGDRAALLVEIESAIKARRHLGRFETRAAAESARVAMRDRWINRKLGLG